MIRRITFSILSVLLLALFAVAVNSDWMAKVADFRYKHPFLWPDRYVNGDLYSMCYLNEYKDIEYKREVKTYPHDSTGVYLYIIHDSYLQKKLVRETFHGVDSIIQIDCRNENQHLLIDTTKRNILLIETAERYARERFGRPEFYKMFIGKKHSAENTKEIHEDVKQSVKRISEYFFNENVNTNLEFQLFDYFIFSPLRGLKSRINLICFDKLPREVAMSHDKRFLFLAESVHPMANTSSFFPLEDAEMISIGQNLKTNQEYFEELGFEAQILSVLPNPVTYLDSSYFGERLPYNGFMHRIQKHVLQSEINYLNCYPLFKNKAAYVFRYGDSHWNWLGKQLWLDAADKELSQVIYKKQSK